MWGPCPAFGQGVEGSRHSHVSQQSFPSSQFKPAWRCRVSFDRSHTSLFRLHLPLSRVAASERICPHSKPLMQERRQ